MKGKNWLIGALLSVALACGSVALSSCGGDNSGASSSSVDSSSQHEHKYGEWTLHNSEEKACDQRLYFRVCNDCGDILWKQGSYDDHTWEVVTTQPTCK